MANSPIIYGGTVGKLLGNSTAGIIASDASGNLSISPVSGTTPIISDPVVYTPTYVGLGTVTNSSMTYSRLGKYLVIQGYLTVGTSTATTATMSLPAGLTIDAGLAQGGTTVYTDVGTWAANSANGFAGPMLAFPSGTTVQFGYPPQASNNSIAAMPGNVIAGAGTYITVFFQVPIASWTSGTTISSFATSTPQVTSYLSGSGTYSTPAGASYLQVLMVGGGGGGGAGAGGSAGGNGGASTFGTTLLSAGGGTGGTPTTSTGVLGGAGGTSSLGTGPLGIAVTGGQGGSAVQNATGVYGTPGNGGSSALGGGGSAGGAPNEAGIAAASNTGGGGGGGTGNGATTSGGSGGGSGGYVSAIITGPLTSYSYSVGAAGTAGTAGGAGLAGGAGGSGIIIVTAFFPVIAPTAQSTILASVGSINGQTVANTALYTVPTGHTAVITNVVVRCTAATAITNGPTAGIGSTAGTNNMFASTAMPSLTGTSNVFGWTLTGASLSVAAAGVVYFNLGTAATGTSQTLAIDVIGYLL